MAAHWRRRQEEFRQQLRMESAEPVASKQKPESRGAHAPMLAWTPRSVAPGAANTPWELGEWRCCRDEPLLPLA